MIASTAFVTSPKSTCNGGPAEVSNARSTTSQKKFSYNKKLLTIDLASPKEHLSILKLLAQNNKIEIKDRNIAIHKELLDKHVSKLIDMVQF